MTPLGDDGTVVVDPYNSTPKMNGEKNGVAPVKAENGHTIKDGDSESNKEEEKKEEPMVGVFEVVRRFDDRNVRKKGYGCLSLKQEFSKITVSFSIIVC